MPFQSESFALKGNHQALLSRLSTANDTVIEQNYLVPKPRTSTFVERQSRVVSPGGDAEADRSTTILGGTLTVVWPRMRLDLIASILGSQFIVSGSPGSQSLRLKRKYADMNSAPFFRYEGRVQYVGEDHPGSDFHRVIYKCRIDETPELSNQTEEYADLQLVFDCKERSDGEFWDWVVNEQGSLLTETLDTVAPTVVSVVPADNASGVAVGDNVVITFSEAINFDASQFELKQIVSATVVNNISCAVTIDATKTIVTMNPASNLPAASNYNVSISGALKDLAGNYIAAPYNSQFATA